MMDAATVEKELRVLRFHLRLVELSITFFIALERNRATLTKEQTKALLDRMEAATKTVFPIDLPAGMEDPDKFLS